MEVSKCCATSIRVGDGASCCQQDGMGALLGADRTQYIFTRHMDGIKDGFVGGCGSGQASNWTALCYVHANAGNAVEDVDAR